MLIKCQKCGRPLREGEEIEGEFRAYYHELASRVSYSMTKPHDAVIRAHVNCNQQEPTNES